MKSNNFLMLEGRLTKDLEVRQNESGYPYGRTSIAINDSYKNSNGEWVNKDPMFVDVLILGEKVNYLKDTYKKGRLVNLRGELRVGSYLTKDGQKRTSVTIKVDGQSLVEVVKRDNSQAQQYNTSQNFVNETINQEYNPGDFGAIDDDNEIPF